jgi:hypothetical protein
MTKKADKKDRPTAQLFVYGQDAAGKPRGARFPATEMEKLVPTVANMNLKFYEGSTEELRALGMKLPVGRFHARGKAFIPNIRRDLYDKILAALVSFKDQADRSQEERAAATKGVEKQDSGPASSPEPDAATNVASGLPQDWPSIASGHMVLVQESLEEGWWEAIVIARENDILTLRYRDFPKVPKFERHVSTIALINPGPA